MKKNKLIAWYVSSKIILYEYDVDIFKDRKLLKIIKTGFTEIKDVEEWSERNGYSIVAYLK